MLFGSSSTPNKDHGFADRSTHALPSSISIDIMNSKMWLDDINPVLIRISWLSVESIASFIFSILTRSCEWHQPSHRLIDWDFRPSFRPSAQQVCHGGGICRWRCRPGPRMEIWMMFLALSSVSLTRVGKWDEWDEGSHKGYELAHVHVTTKPSLATPHESSASSKHSDSRRDVRGSSEMEVPNRTMPLRREHITNTSCHCKTDFIRSTF